MKEFKLYTDGSCLNNGNNGTGGYCAILLDSDSASLTIKGGQPNTTNSRMEMVAIIQGLKVVPFPSIVHVYCDAQFIVKGINEWLSSWKQKNFRKVANIDLWKEFLAVSEGIIVKAHWVKAHSGNCYNELCNYYAHEEALKLKGSLCQ